MKQYNVGEAYKSVLCQTRDRSLTASHLSVSVFESLMHILHICAQDACRQLRVLTLQGGNM